MKPPLTLTLLLSADGKIATRSGESLLSLASPEYQSRVAENRAKAGCLLIDTSSSPFEIPVGKPVIILGHSEAWQPEIEKLPQDIIATIDSLDELTGKSLQSIAQDFDAENIHCEPSSHLARKLLEEEAVDVIDLTITHTIPGGHAADTMTGNGASMPFPHSQQFSLISHEPGENEIHLRYALESSGTPRNQTAE